MYVALADNQDITRAGMMYVCGEMDGVQMHRAEDKTELIEQLKQHPDAVIVVDYTLFDINDVDELEILHERFPEAQWILFSVDLSGDLVRRVIAVSPRFSILLKESPIQENRKKIWRFHFFLLLLHSMTERKDKQKRNRAQLNSQLEAMTAKPVMVNTWMENLGKYLLDISKYVTTGVVISSLFKDVSDSSAIYIIGTVVAVSTLIVGLVLTNKKKKKEE